MFLLRSPVYPWRRDFTTGRPSIRRGGKTCKVWLKRDHFIRAKCKCIHGLSPNGKEWTLGRLIRELAELDGLERIRYTTSHPKDMDDDLISAHGEVPKLMPYLHLPIQSGSNTILKT